MTERPRVIQRILGRLGGGAGGEPTLRRHFPGVTFYRPELCVIPTTDNVSIGAHSVLDAVRVFNWDERIRVSVGRYCSVGFETILLGGGEHRQDHFTTRNIWEITGMPAPARVRAKGDLVIGHDVWIGMRATILSGVELGTGSVVGAGAVVTRSLPPYSIAVGTPARVVRRRFDPETIDLLMRSEWWNREPDELTALSDSFARGYGVEENRGVFERLAGRVRRG